MTIKEIIRIIVMLILTALPTVLTLLILMLTKDALIPIAVLVVINYMISCFIYSIIFSPFKFSWFLGSERRVFG
jgi:hypothetical protein